MSPSPSPPEPIEPHVEGSALPAGGYPYDGMFRSPSLLLFTNSLSSERNRQDLPNPLLSTTPLHPQTSEPTRRDSFTSSRRSSWSTRSRANSASQPPTPRPATPAPVEQAFDDPFFRTIPPPPGMRPFPLPTVHTHAHATPDGATEYDTSAAYGGPNDYYITSSDFIPWHVTRDWDRRTVSKRGDQFMAADVYMQGRGARRHVKVWQKKEGGGDRRGSDGSTGGFGADR